MISIRILHFADLHIGVENYGRTDPETGLSSRLRDFLETYDDLVDYAIKTEVDLVLFCGDAYKSRDPSQTHQREFALRVARLSRAGIPVFLLVGNHDTPHVIGRATALEIFNTLDVKNIYIGDTLKTYVINTKSGPVQIVSVPWIKRSSFLTREDTRGMSPDEINEDIQERLTVAIQNEAEKLDPGLPAVFSGHVTISQSVTGSEQSMMLGRDHVLLNSNVALPEFDYVALGHIHRHQILGENPPTVYSGSLQRVDFGEEKDEKGFCVIEIDSTKPKSERQTRWEFIKTNARRFLTISIAIDILDTDPTISVLKEIEKHSIEETIVRLRIKVPASVEHLLNEREIRDALSNAHFIGSISKEILDRSRPRIGDAYSKGIPTRTILETYFRTRDVSDDRLNSLMNKADELINSE